MRTSKRHRMMSRAHEPCSLRVEGSYKQYLHLDSGTLYDGLFIVSVEPG